MVFRGASLGRCPFALREAHGRVRKRRCFMKSSHSYFKRLLAVGLGVAMSVGGMSFPAVTMAATVGKADMVTANPAGDCSTAMNISWQSSQKSATLYYRKKSSSTWISVSSTGRNDAYDKIVSGRNVDYYGGLSISSVYTHHVSLTGLSADTDYEYKIETGGSTYTGYSFHTAPTGASYSIGWIGDVHSYDGKPKLMQYVDSMVSFLTSKTGKTLDFFLSHGDLVKFGMYYESWQQWNNSSLMKDYMLAAVPGNKEYYYTSDPVNNSKTKGYSGVWFEQMFNNPKNGPSGVEGTYWFRYGRTLYVGINSCQEQSSSIRRAAVSAQRQWFSDLLDSDAIKGTYDYLVCYTHYPYWYPDEGTQMPDTSYDEWYDLFDKYKVDIAFCGDCHEYVRTKKLYNGSETSSSEKGTYYVTYSMVQTSDSDSLSVRTASSEYGDDTTHIAKVGDAGTGIGIITFTDSSIEYKMYPWEKGYSGSYVDSLSIPKKTRPGGSGQVTPTPTNAPTPEPTQAATNVFGTVREYTVDSDSNTMDYSAGEYVLYDGKVYRAVQNIYVASLNSLTKPTHFTIIGDYTGITDVPDYVTDDDDTTKDYAAGSYVKYEGVVYQAACDIYVASMNSLTRTDRFVPVGIYIEEVAAPTPTNTPTPTVTNTPAPTATNTPVPTQAPANGWKQVGSSWYYYKNGTAVTGWFRSAGKWYYFDNNGVMKTGWVKDAGKWYYLDKNGAMKTGWLSIDGTWYYFETSGALSSNKWVKSGNNWYHTDANGVMMTNKWQKSSGKWYYFGSDGRMVANTTLNIGGVSYTFDADGAWQG